MSWGLLPLGLLAFWLVGGIVGRIGGLLLVLAGIANVALNSQAGGLLPIAIGAGLWLAGHWHYALRHHTYKSPLARYVFCRWSPEWLDPTRKWAVATTEAVGPEAEERGRWG